MFRLTIKRKIVLALVLLAAGFGTLGAVAVPVLRDLAHSVGRADALARVLNTVTDAQVAALTLSSGRHGVTAQTVGAFVEEVSRVDAEHARALAAVRGSVGGGELEDSVAGIERDLHAYAEGTMRWASFMAEAGFDAGSGLRGEAAALGDQLIEVLEWMSVLKDLLYRVREAEANFLVRRSPEFRERFRAAVLETEAKIAELGMQDFETSPGTTLGRQLRRYADTFERTAQAMASAWEAERHTGTALLELTQKVNGAKAQTARVLEEAQRGAVAGSRKATGAIVGGGIAVALVLGALLSWVGLGAVRGLHRTADLLRDMAMGEGDLTKRLPQRLATCSELLQCDHRACPSHGRADACWSAVGSFQTLAENVRCRQILSGQFASCEACPAYRKTRALEADELDRVAHWFNTFIDKVRHVVARTSEASAGLAVSVERLSGTTSQIAVSNDETSAQSQAVATSAEQMSATVEEVARITALLGTSSEEASRVASEGNAVISQALQAMAEISTLVEHAAGTVKTLGDRSAEISVVLEVIEDIADQTNLLALNAAIEAARAGDHGRGFAVVADEVRKLAEKTMKATDQIAGTVTSIQAEGKRAVEAMGRGREGAEKGGRLSAEARQAVEAIEASVAESFRQAQHIATATEQMLTTTHQIAASMDEMAKAVTQNSAAAAEIADSVKSVTEEASALKTLTATFRT
jgi:methyl-accepting chemotaxis protein